MSGSMALIEDTEDNNYWDRGSEGKGKNMMGVLLEKLRDTLSVKRKPHFTKPTYRPNSHYSVQKRHTNKHNDTPACWYCGEANHMSDACRHWKYLFCNLSDQTVQQNIMVNRTLGGLHSSSGNDPGQ